MGMIEDLREQLERLARVVEVGMDAVSVEDIESLDDCYDRLQDLMHYAQEAMDEVQHVADQAEEWADEILEVRNGIETD